MNQVKQRARRKEGVKMSDVSQIKNDTFTTDYVPLFLNFVFVSRKFFTPNDSHSYPISPCHVYLHQEKDDEYMGR